jgi:hypothetical protein
MSYLSSIYRFAASLWGTLVDQASGVSQSGGGRLKAMLIRCTRFAILQSFPGRRPDPGRARTIQSHGGIEALLRPAPPEIAARAAVTTATVSRSATPTFVDRNAAFIAQIRMFNLERAKEERPLSLPQAAAIFPPIQILFHRQFIF